jgi:hypothetical protein
MGLLYLGAQGYVRLGLPEVLTALPRTTVSQMRPPASAMQMIARSNKPPPSPSVPKVPPKKTRYSNVGNVARSNATRITSRTASTMRRTRTASHI